MLRSNRGIGDPLDVKASTTHFVMGRDPQFVETHAIAYLWHIYGMNINQTLSLENLK